MIGVTSTTCAMTIAVGVVIIGGIKRIASTAEKIVPSMCAIYVMACLYILFSHGSEIPGAFGAIIDGAFNPDAAFGGFIGVRGAAEEARDADEDQKA